MRSLFLLGYLRELGQTLLGQITGKNEAVESLDRRIKDLAAKSQEALRLQTIPGVGPITALAIEAFAPPLEAFRCGRDFAAWLGIVPTQHSSGGVNNGSGGCPKLVSAIFGGS